MSDKHGKLNISREIKQIQIVSLIQTRQAKCVYKASSLMANELHFTENPSLPLPSAE